MRLIDADTLLETMENFFTKAEDEARYAGRRNAEVTWNDAVYMIKTAPTIEPEPYDEETSNLKPCPFCGAEATLNYKEALETWIAECSNFSCPASYMIGMDYNTKEEAIETWNRRTKDEAN